MRPKTEPWVALLSTVMVSLTWAFMPSNWMPAEFTDPVSHLCSMLLLLNISPVVVIPSVFLGILNDERFILGLPFVVLWHFPPRWEFGWLKQSRYFLGSAICSLGLYVVFRNALRFGWIGPGVQPCGVYTDMGKDFKGFHPYVGSWTTWLLNVAASFRWAWVIVVAYAGMLLENARFLFASMFVTALALGTFASFLVFDIGRSVGFLVPAWMLAISGLYSKDSDKLRFWLRLIVVALVVSPVFSYADWTLPIWQKPWILNLSDLGSLRH